MFRTAMLAALTLALSGLAAQSQSAFVAPCRPDLPGHARSIAEPWEDNTLTFANGAVRLVILDMIEPSGAAFHLLVLSPPYEASGERQCRLLSYGDGRGFGFLSFERAEADYDPVTGLSVVMDMGRYNPDTGLNDAWALAVTIDQSTGAVSGAW